MTARATVGTLDGLSARDVAVTLTKGKDAIDARVTAVRSRGAARDVTGVRIEGAGEPLVGELHRRGGTVAARVSAPRVDVPTLLRVAGLKTEIQAGAVGLDVDISASRSSTKGHAGVTLRGVAYGDRVRGLDANVRAKFAGRDADVHVDARDATGDTIAVDSEKGRLGAGALDPRAWAASVGSVHGAVNVDLDRVNEATHGALPFDDLRGWLTARLDVTRGDPNHRPSLALDASTRGLVFTTTPKTVPVGAHAVTVVGRSFHSEGLDARATAKLDAETGVTSFGATLTDAKGRLFEADAKTTLPMTALLSGASGDALLGTKVRAHVEMPLHSIGAVPALFESMPVRGEVGFSVDLVGSAKEPHVRALLHGRDLQDAEDSTPVPISFDAAAIYDGDLARAKIVAVHDRAQVLDVVANLAIRASEMERAVIPWDASADVHFTGFPIGSVTAFVDENRLDADLSGSIALRGLHKVGQLDAKLALTHVNIDGAKFGDATAIATLRDGALEATARLAQPDGSANVRVTGGMSWGDAIAPSVDSRKPIDVGLQAKNFRLAMLAPFVRSVVSELDGRLNADTKLHVLPGAKDGTMTGAIVLDEARLDIPDAGGELHNAKARIFMKPWGVWNVAEISADGTSGHFTASAVAHVNGLQFRSGEAHLRIAEKDKLPLDMQGMELGTVWGRIDATGAIAGDGKKVAIDVKVPELHVMLPQSIAHGVQSTAPDATIDVGSIRPNGVVTILPVDGSAPPPAPPKPTSTTATASPTIHVTTHLGPDLEIRRDTTVRAFVADGPTIDIGKETTISGGITIPRGYIELQGKRFQIEKGKVSFTGQPVGDPVVVATASYEAADGTKVYADFTGPVKTGKLTLRSEPELGQNEILALLLFGSADGTFGQSAPPGQQGNDMTQAASLAGGVVTEGLNKAISGVSGIDVQTKVDTQEAGDPRPEVEVALSRAVSATLVYNLGVPPPGQNPDDTLLVLDWRFNKRYATEATLGDKGTSILDLTWKYRY